jgi:hypothetical protein
MYPQENNMRLEGVKIRETVYGTFPPPQYRSMEINPTDGDVANLENAIDAMGGRIPELYMGRVVNECSSVSRVSEGVPDTFLGGNTCGVITIRVMEKSRLTTQPRVYYVSAYTFDPPSDGNKPNRHARWYINSVKYERQGGGARDHTAFDYSGQTPLYVSTAASVASEIAASMTYGDYHDGGVNHAEKAWHGVIGGLEGDVYMPRDMSRPGVLAVEMVNSYLHAVNTGYSDPASAMLEASLSVGQQSRRRGSEESGGHYEACGGNGFLRAIGELTGTTAVVNSFTLTEVDIVFGGIVSRSIMSLTDPLVTFERIGKAKNVDINDELGGLELEVSIATMAMSLVSSHAAATLSAALMMKGLFGEKAKFGANPVTVVWCTPLGSQMTPAEIAQLERALFAELDPIFAHYPAGELWVEWSPEGVSRVMVQLDSDKPRTYHFHSYMDGATSAHISPNPAAIMNPSQGIATIIGALGASII